MNLTIIQIFALIVIALAAIKIIVILIKPKAWLELVKVIYAKPKLTMVISLILAIITLRYLIKEITITQIFASMIFIMLIGALTISIYFKEMSPLFEKMLKDRKILKKAWLPIIVWIVLLIWAIVEIF